MDSPVSPELQADTDVRADIEHERVRLAGNAVALGYAKGLEDVGLT